MDELQLLGRLIFVAVFVDSGINHLRNMQPMVGYAKSFGAPSPEVTVPLSGVMMLLGSLFIALGFLGDLGALLFAIFLVPASFTAHAFWKETDPNMQAAQRAQFFKNVSLFGACVFLFAVFAQGGDFLPYTLGGSLF